jgi:transketolase
MALAPVAYNLFQRHLIHDPSDPKWIGRDRFILSCGHSSLTLYTQLFYSGYGLELDDLKAFRQANSLTPAHPEFGHTLGVEMTTGPLGAGLATAVGFAMAARYERGLFDPAAAPGSSIFDHAIWVICSDGDLQEGVTSEASSLAGTQALGNLNVIYDDNRISIEGDTHLAFTEDVSARYRAYGWHVVEVHTKADGDVDLEALDAAMLAAKAESTKPSLIRLHTVIAWPAPTLRNSPKSHGAALGEEEVAQTKKALGLNPEEKFAISQDVLSHARKVKERGGELHKVWNSKFEIWKGANPDKAALLDRLIKGDLPSQISSALPVYAAGKDVPTRKVVLPT